MKNTTDINVGDIVRVCSPLVIPDSLYIVYDITPRTIGTSARGEYQCWFKVNGQKGWLCNKELIKISTSSPLETIIYGFAE